MWDNTLGLVNGNLRPAKGNPLAVIKGRGITSTVLQPFAFGCFSLVYTFQCTYGNIKSGDVMAELVILTGVSGAGKSTAIFAFEEMGYYCVENVPLPLLPSLFHLVENDARYKKTLIGVNISEAKEAIEEARKHLKLSFKVLCLDATTAELLSRYKLTRHVHPQQTSGITLEKAIINDKEFLNALRAEVDVMIDTSGLEVVDFRRKLFANFQKKRRNMLTVSFVSFGYKHGIPTDVDLIIDTRFLPNPFYIRELSKLTGIDEPVIAYLEALPQTKTYLKHVTEYLDYYLEKANDDIRPSYVVGVGCSGGQHRSVYIAEYLNKHFEEKYNTLVSHRDLAKYKGQ